MIETKSEEKTESGYFLIWSFLTDASDCMQRRLWRSVCKFFSWYFSRVSGRYILESVSELFVLNILYYLKLKHGIAYIAWIVILWRSVQVYTQMTVFLKEGMLVSPPLRFEHECVIIPCTEHLQSTSAASLL